MALTASCTLLPAQAGPGVAEADIPDACTTDAIYVTILPQISLTATGYVPSVTPLNTFGVW